MRQNNHESRASPESSTSHEPTSLPGSLILPPPGASEERGGKMRDPGNEVGHEHTTHRPAKRAYACDKCNRWDEPTVTKN